MPQGPFGLMSLQEAMDLLGVSRATIDRWRKSKSLPYLKIGKEIWIDRVQLEQWIRGGKPDLEKAEPAAPATFHESAALHEASEFASAPAASHEPLPLHEASGHAAAPSKSREPAPLHGASGFTAAPPVSSRSLAPADISAAATTITVGYQSGAALLWSALVVKSRGWFEQELRLAEPSRRYQVAWRHADSGMELVEELIAGRVQIASVGDYPIAASRELGRLLPGFQPIMLALDGKCPDGSGISLIARKGAGIRYGDQLSAAVSTVSRSSASRRLEAVMKHGRSGAAPVLGSRRMADCLSALLEGRVEAAMLWEPYLSWARSIGAGQTVESEESGGDYLTGILADEGWAGENESVAVAYLKAHIRAHDLIRRSPLEAAVLIRDASGIPLDVILPVLSSIRWDASVYSRDLLTLSRMEEDYSVTRLRSSYLAIPAYRAAYLQEAAAALKLPSLPDMAIPYDWTDDRLY